MLQTEKKELEVEEDRQLQKKASTSIPLVKEKESNIKLAKETKFDSQTAPFNYSKTRRDIKAMIREGQEEQIGRISCKIKDTNSQCRNWTG